MKVKYKFEVMDLDDGLVAVPVGPGAEQFRGVIKVNETAISIFKLLEQETTEESIVESLLKEYTGEKTEITLYVHEFLEKIKAEGILEV